MTDQFAIDNLLKENPALYKAMLEQISAEKSLYAFTEMMWEFVEPSNPFIGNWHIEAICEHLEAVSHGQITRLLMNVPPGTMKSLLTDVFWPAWEWIHLPHLRYVCTSYSAALTERDNGRFLRVVTSDIYKAMWGDKFSMTRESITKMENDKTGWKIATSTEGMGTGERGDRVIVDDPHNVKDGESEAVRKSTLQYFNEVLPTRVTNPISSAMVVIMQRVHEEDVSGNILTRDLGYTHLCLPMEFEPDRRCVVFLPQQQEGEEPFFVDPRQEPGELLFAQRMPDWVVARDKNAMGPYAAAGQFQQSPVPRGGGIIKREYWKLWPEDGEEFNTDGTPKLKLEYPVMDLIIASVDTAYSKSTEADYNALSILGLFKKAGSPKIMLMHAWKKRLDFRGEIVIRLPDETENEYRARRRKTWGMLEWTAHECNRFGVDYLLVEGKATGKTLAQEIRKVYSNEKWATTEVNPRGDKIARAYSVQHIWAEGMMYAPERAWAEEVIQEMQYFPKGAHDDLTDCVVQGVRWLRDTGWAIRRDEQKAEADDRAKNYGKQAPLYDV